MPTLHSVTTHRRTHGAALEIAAHSLSESRSLGGIEEVVSDRALDHHYRGLFQYAAIRVGPARAERLLSQLAAPRDDAERQSSLPSPQGAGPRLYKRLRTLCLAATGATGRQERLDARSRLFWGPPDPRYAEALARLRAALGEAEAEVVELHFARGLELADIAEVTQSDACAVTRCCEQALAAVEAQFGGGALPSHDRSPGGVLLEAFSLDPSLTPPPPSRARAPLVRPGDVIGGRYEIEEPLGSGAFADVFRARDREVEGHTVALKISRMPCLDARSEQAALRELQLLSSVFHPSVTQMKDHGWHHGHCWFVMPLYRGETLATRLRRGPLGRAEARAIFVPLAEALATLHRAGVLHQDVKPDNIFLADVGPTDPAGEERAGGNPIERSLSEARRPLPVLLDLGVAAKDAEVVLAGTPAYLAPEVAARFAGLPDPAPIGPKADVFSLALTLRDALEPDPLDPPLASVDAFLRYRATMAPSPRLRSRTLRDLRGVFARWLHLSPDARPTAAELCTELAALTAPQERAARRTATLRWLVPTAVALSCLFGAVVYVLSQEAALQRLEAADARSAAERAAQRAASISADLALQEARRKELEASVSRLEEDYQQSRLTRDELASRLALTDAELQIADERAARLEQRLVQREQEQAHAHAERSRLERALDAARDDAVHSTRALQRVRGRAESQEIELAEERLRKAQLEQRLAELEVALEHTRRKLSALRRAAAHAPPAEPGGTRRAR